MNIPANWSISPIQLQDILLIGRIRIVLTQSLILALISSFCQRDSQLTSPRRSTILMVMTIRITQYQTNQQYILENQNWMNQQIKHHIMTCLVCMSVITLFFSLLETLHKKDYLYLRYSGLSKQRYLKYRMIEAGIILSIIAILFSIYALFCIYLPISWIILLMTYILVVPTVLVLYFMFLKFFYGRFDV